MKCSKCGKETKCKNTKVYYAQVRGVKSSTRRDDILHSTTTTTTAYGSIFNGDISLCSDCIIKRRKRDILLLPVIILVILVLIGGPLQSEIFFGILGAVFLAFVILTIIRLVTKRYMDIPKAYIYPTARKQLKKKLKKGCVKSNINFGRSTHLICRCADIDILVKDRFMSILFR